MGGTLLKGPYAWPSTKMWKTDIKLPPPIPPIVPATSTSTDPMCSFQVRPAPPYMHAGHLTREPVLVRDCEGRSVAPPPPPRRGSHTPGQTRRTEVSRLQHRSRPKHCRLRQVGCAPRFSCLLSRLGPVQSPQARATWPKGQRRWYRSLVLRCSKSASSAQCRPCQVSVWRAVPGGQCLEPATAPSRRVGTHRHAFDRRGDFTAFGRRIQELHPPDTHAQRSGRESSFALGRLVCRNSVKVRSASRNTHHRSSQRHPLKSQAQISQIAGG